MIIEAKGVSKLYTRKGETVTALQDVSLSVQERERIGQQQGSLLCLENLHPNGKEMNKSSIAPYR